MATSPIYNWPEPDNTDLVKNGALAIRTLGNAIDTTMATMVPKTIVDAKGDLIAGTAADTTSRLAVGNNGETLVADSSTSTGLRYTAGNPISNPVINSAMQIWQRGTSVAVSGSASLTFAADRWGFFRTGFATGMTVSRQATGDTTNLSFIQYSQRVQRDSGNTSTGIIYTLQNFESINSIPFAGKTVTFSFYARAGANYSSASSALNYSVSTGTGTDQNLLNGFTGQTSPINATATLTTTWQRFTGTATLSASATQVGVGFNYTPVGTAGANDWFEFTGVQLDIGSVALPFRTNGATLQGELAACQRYYFRFTGNTNQVLIPYAFASGTNYANGQIQFPVPMRTTPTSLDSATIQYVNYAGSAYAMTSVAFNEACATAAQIYGNTSGTTANWLGKISGSATGSYVGFSAEL